MVVDLLRDSTICVSIYLRVTFVRVSEVDVTKNHYTNLKSALLIATISPKSGETRLIILHGKLNVKASEDLTLYLFSAAAYLYFKVLEKSVLTMYIA